MFLLVELCSIEKLQYIPMNIPWSIFGSPQKKSVAGYGYIPFITKNYPGLNDQLLEDDPIKSPSFFKSVKIHSTSIAERISQNFSSVFPWFSQVFPHFLQFFPLFSQFFPHFPQVFPLFSQVFSTFSSSFSNVLSPSIPLHLKGPGRSCGHAVGIPQPRMRPEFLGKTHGNIPTIGFIGYITIVRWDSWRQLIGISAD